MKFNFGEKINHKKFLKKNKEKKYPLQTSIFLLWILNKRQPPEKLGNPTQDLKD